MTLRVKETGFTLPSRTAFLYTHNWKALSLYIYCIKPFCPYLKKKKEELLVISLHIRFKNSST